MQALGIFATVLLCTFPLLTESAPRLSAPSGNVVRLPLRRSTVRDLEILPRDVLVPLENQLMAYLVDLSIGSPPQTVQLVLDTGSSEIWAYSSGACTSCGGTYDPSLSRTAEPVDNIGTFSQGYADGTSASGYYVTDKAQLGSTQLTEIYLGVATSTTKKAGHGIMGISFDGSQSSSKQHPGIMDTLISQNLVSSNSYSIFLDDVNAGTGSILFGGIDESKFTGELVPVPIVLRQEEGDGPGLNLAWTSLTITDASGASADLATSDFPIPVLLDTGSTLTTVPYTIFWQLYDYFKATGPDNGISHVDCNMPSGYLTFGFGTDPVALIRVLFSELAIPVSDDECWFGLQPHDGSGPGMTFGDTFLRSAYINVDFDANQIELAQSSWQ